MIVAVVRDVKFKVEPHRHTVHYAEQCKRVEGLDKQKFFGTLKAVIAPDYPSAVKLLRNHVQVYLDAWTWLEPKYKDFTFGVSTSETEDNSFWIIPSSTDCKDHPVEGEILTCATIGRIKV